MNRLLSTSLSTLLVGAVGAAALILDPVTVTSSDAAPPSAVAPLLSPDLPTYPGAREISIGDDLKINGQSVAMHQFFSDDAPEEIASFYTDAFREIAGPSTITYQLGNAHYAGFTDDAGRFIQVMVLAQEDGTSMVIPNVADGPIRPGLEASALEVPLPSDKRNLVSSRSSELGRDAINAQFVTDLDLTGVAEFYRQRLPALGFKQAPGAVLPEDISLTGVLRFIGDDGSRLTVSVQGLSAGGGSLVFLLHELPAQGGDQP